MNEFCILYAFRVSKHNVLNKICSRPALDLRVQRICPTMSRFDEVWCIQSIYLQALCPLYIDRLILQLGHDPYQNSFH